ncbi:MAG: protein transporter tim10 [Cyphobasidiales sp. Tagirdzhanova-0007]|nr:MAG: protein transporter tim10 [Cyphobasidiales sp. Tagirdzhanova-0007]
MTSMFGRPQALPSSAYATPAVNNERLEAATVEIEMVSDMFNRLIKACHAKCIDRRYQEDALSKGEGVCGDRCVAKYFLVNERVGERMQAQGSAIQAQQAQETKKSGGWFG